MYWSRPEWPEGYFPYGSSSDRRDARNRYRFIGVERDEDTGLCMTGPRTYDPVIGRFLQGDPRWQEDPEHDPYAYSSGSPLRRVDPSGYSDTLAEEDQFTSQLTNKVNAATEEGVQTDFARAALKAQPPVPSGGSSYTPAMPAPGAPVQIGSIRLAAAEPYPVATYVHEAFHSYSFGNYADFDVQMAWGHLTNEFIGQTATGVGTDEQKSMGRVLAVGLGNETIGYFLQDQLVAQLSVVEGVRVSTSYFEEGSISRADFEQLLQHHAEAYATAIANPSAGQFMGWEGPEVDPADPSLDWARRQFLGGPPPDFESFPAVIRAREILAR